MRLFSRWHEAAVNAFGTRALFSLGRHALAVWLVAAWLSPTASAEIIIDDFDDPAEVISPEMFEEFVDTVNVGHLGATRSIRIAGGRGEPSGFLDSALTESSTLTGHIPSTNPFETTRVAIQSNYTFSPTDFTQDGRNNALFFDFLQVTSGIPPSLFMILLWDGRDVYAHIDVTFPLRDGPFTVVVPFDEFPPRGGGSTLPDYTTIYAMNVELRASELAGGGPDPLNFFMQLDRIRVGRMIPEPSLWALSFGG